MPDAEDTDPSVELPLRCQFCGQRVILTYRPSEQYRTRSWSCPTCWRIQKIDLQGSIVRVAIRA